MLRMRGVSVLPEMRIERGRLAITFVVFATAG
ncbi:hypothetical protein Shell_1030 [Staphylothermus hellenicus DSM 12710]|uniref:Uncharacterized protein n=1 Tax=Staphylothermus hellenicus (strain DSM 12710 / JCM 10830 / BK20S6-10-b1 / P8) TaxID=591019 RepID=D7D8N8_STAHD|nr:hypothetical protein Shell_1030 [Staphylothermus hellenicus DSM 12710]